METFPYNPMAEFSNILNPNMYDASSMSSALGTSGLSSLGQGGMSFSSTNNPLINNFNNQITDGFSINNSVTPSWGSAFDSFRSGEAGLNDLGGMLGSKARTFGQGIESDLANNQTYQDMHGGLSAKGQFGNIWGGLQALTGLYGALKQSRMANKQYDLQNDMWKKSWDANKKSVNESVDLRAANRYNENPEARAAHVAKYSI